MSASSGGAKKTRHRTGAPNMTTFTGSPVTDMAAIIAVILLVSLFLTLARTGRTERLENNRIDKQGYRRH
jgi:hypothetical protein